MDIGAGGYYVLFGLLFSCGLGVPIPEDVPLLVAGALGSEKPLGQGAVGMERFVAKLKEIGYKNPLNIEREGVPDHQQKLRDIKMGVGLLERLLAVRHPSRCSQ